MFDGVLGKAVADEEDAQRRLYIVTAARTARTRTDHIGNVVRVDRIGRFLHAQITHLLVFAVRIVNRGSAVVNPDLAARDAVDPAGRIGAVAEEHAAVGVVGEDLAVIGAPAERVGRMVGQTEQTAAAGAARAFLTLELARRTGNLVALLRLVRALTLIGQILLHVEVDSVVISLHAENGVRKDYLTSRFLSLCVQYS